MTALSARAEISAQLAHIKSELAKAHDQIRHLDGFCMGLVSTLAQQVARLNALPKLDMDSLESRVMDLEKIYPPQNRAKSIGVRQNKAGNGKLQIAANVVSINNYQVKR